MKTKLCEEIKEKTMTNKGKLYLIPNTLGDSPIDRVLPLSVKNTVEACSYFIVENEKTARAFIKKICPEKSQPSLTLFTLNKFTSVEYLQMYIQPCKEGFDMGVISDAGCPAVADPGAVIVELAHRNNIEVIPLVGPSSILLAVMGSGFNGQSFAFNGYLPIEKDKRKQYLKRLEAKVIRENQTQIFIETPYRNEKTMQDILNHLSQDTKLCIATDITLDSQYIKTLSVRDWKKEKICINKRPTIFVVGR